jgi:LuxR family maltose regulon positive regulatory protein
LHLQASEWYEQNGFAAEATEHALRGEHFERAARLIDGQVDALWQRAEHARMQHWLDRIPVEWVLAKPQLGILRAFYLFAGGQLDEGENLLRDAEEALEFDGEGTTAKPELEQIQMSDSERATLRGRAAVFRALISSDHGDVPGIITYASKALALLSQHDLTWRSLAAIALGDAHSYRGNMAASYQARSEALRACQAAGDTYCIIIASLKLASTLRAQGHLQQTLEICQQEIKSSEESRLPDTTTVGCLLAISGEVLAERNDLDGALRQAKRGVELTANGMNLALLGHSSLCLARVLFSTGDLDGVQELLDQMDHTTLGYDVPPWLTNQMATWQVRIWLAQGNLDAASQWAEKRGLGANRESVPVQTMDFYLLFDYIMLARVLIATNRLDEATGLLQRLLEPAEAGERTTRLIEILVLQALASQAGRDTTQAMATLERAFALAEPEGFIRIFVDEGPPMAQLLYEALIRGIAAEYVRRLLAAFPVAEPEQAAPLETQAPESDLIEPLSERELEVVQLIAEGLTNPEIASRLFLSLNTVKAHTRNIYGKLSVHNRTQAVARARALGVLPST